MAYADLSCVVHVHSTYSDGTATVPEILAAARTAEADCVLLTDHDTLQAKHDGWEGRHDGVLLVVGEEITPPGGHLLVFGTDAEIPHDGRLEPDLCREVARAGGLGIAAHPFSEGSRISTRLGPPHPWGALGEPGCRGIELWSLATDAAEAWRGPREVLATLRAPEVLDGPPDRHLRAWDRLCRDRRLVAIGGLDAHQPGLRVRGRVRSIMPHRRWFALLRTHVLVAGEPTPASVCAAIAEGRCYLALRHLGDPRGFSLEANGVPMGGEAVWAGQTIRVTVPASADIRLLCDGEEVARTHAAALRHETACPGVYRVEVSRRGRTWIVSNPVYLRAAGRGHDISDVSRERTAYESFLGTRPESPSTEVCLEHLGRYDDGG